MYKSGLLRKTLYFYPQEWDAIRKASYEQQKSYADIVRLAVREYLTIEDDFEDLCD